MAGNPNNKRSPRWAGVLKKGNAKGTTANNSGKEKRWKGECVASQKAQRGSKNKKGISRRMARLQQKTTDK